MLLHKLDWILPRDSFQDYVFCQCAVTVLDALVKHGQDGHSHGVSILAATILTCYYQSSVSKV